jgi:hypothetical protein
MRKILSVLCLSGNDNPPLNLPELDNKVQQTEQCDVKGPYQRTEWILCLKCDGKEAKLRLKDPFAEEEADVRNAFYNRESIVKWYVDKHTEEPFEVVKAESAAQLLRGYGQRLAQSLADSGILPRDGDLDLEIVSQPPKSSSISKIGEADLQKLHWELLEDVTVWPADYTFQSLTVTRCIPTEHRETSNATEWLLGSQRVSIKKFSILLVVARPSASRDPDYHLVSRQLVAVVDELSERGKDLNVSVHILRPPTWMAFKEHLLVDCDPGHYDMVHFDMHGDIVDAQSRNPRSVALENQQHLREF